MQYRLTVYRGKWAITWHDDGTKRHSTGIKGVKENRPAAEIELNEFLANLRRDKSKPTGPITVDRCLSGYFEAHPAVFPRPSLLSFFSNMLPDHIDKEICETYAKKRESQGIALATYRDELGILRTAMLWAEGEKWGIVAPKVWRPSGARPRDRWLQPEEANRLLAGAGLPHIRLFIMIALHTAARAGAILDLTWDRVSFDINRIDFNKPGKATGRKRRAVVRMSPELRQVLKDASRDAMGDHVIEYAGKPVKSVKKGFRAAVVRAGLSKVTPHVIRHTAATWMRQRRVPSAEIAGMPVAARPEPTDFIALTRLDNQLTDVVVGFTITMAGEIVIASAYLNDGKMAAPCVKWTADEAAVWPRRIAAAFRLLA